MPAAKARRPMPPARSGRRWPLPARWAQRPLERCKPCTYGPATSMPGKRGRPCAQWREGMGGRTGLDYAGVRAWFDLQGIRGAKRRRLFAGIQACEAATLEVWAEQREPSNP